MHTVDQLNLATAKSDDLIILNILVTAKMANFGLSGMLIFSFFSRPFGGNHISSHNIIFLSSTNEYKS